MLTVPVPYMATCCTKFSNFFTSKFLNNLFIKISKVDPHSFFADPDPAFTNL